MTNDALSLLGGLFSAVWQLFNGWYLPGTNVTPFAFSVSILFVWLLVRRIVRLFDSEGSVKGRGEDD